VLRKPSGRKLIWITGLNAANPAATSQDVHPAITFPASKAIVKRQFLWGKCVLGVAYE
jgi:hypothetical protein